MDRDELLERVVEASPAAWTARENAFVFGGTKVGCAVLTSDSRTFLGCNVEHRFRCHDVHAEVCAISSMVGAGARTIEAVLVVAQREFFTPCGGCMDWIVQFASPSAIVVVQGEPNGPLRSFSINELMPFYPR